MEVLKSSEFLESLDLSVVPNPVVSCDHSTDIFGLVESLDLAVVPNPDAGINILISPSTESPPRASTFTPCEWDIVFSELDISSLPSFDFLSTGRPSANGAIAGTCIICSLPDEHGERHCPYRSFIPKNAIVSSCDIVCQVCGQLFTGRCCNQDVGCAKLRLCDNCLMFGDHWPSQCPKEYSDIELSDDIYL